VIFSKTGICAAAIVAQRRIRQTKR
jgi:hypothetical protein